MKMLNMKRNFVNVEREELMINVVGLSASGKSTIMLMIQKMLIDKGFNVSTNYLDGPLLNKEQSLIREKSVIKQNKKIIINEVQACRNLIKE